MTAGAFTPEARAAIYEAGDHRCVGCGRPDITAQHRRARGMGGNRRPEISLPSNGVPLCGDGVRGCHGWTERHPTFGALLGWRLTSGQDQLVEPFWTRFGWRLWTCEEDTAVTLTGSRTSLVQFFAVAFVDEPELDRRVEREAAVHAYRNRQPGWR